MVIDGDGIRAAKPLIEDLGKNVVLVFFPLAWTPV